MNDPTPTGRVLTVNGGSSSVKFALYEPGKAEPLVLYEGRV